MLQVAASAAALAAEPEAEVAARGRAAVDLTLEGLSDPHLRARFLAADQVGVILQGSA